MTSASPPAAPPRAAPAAPGPGQPDLRLRPPRRRRLPLVILTGVLLTVLGAAVGGGLLLQAGSRVPVLVVARPVEAGQILVDADLAEARLAADPAARTIPARARAQVVGQAAISRLVPGQILTTGLLTAHAPPGPDQALVPVIAHPGQLPDGLKPLDRVALLRARPASAPPDGGADGGRLGETLVADAVVWAVTPSKVTEQVVVTLIVRDVDRGAAVRYGSAGQAALIMLPATDNGAIKWP